MLQASRRLLHGLAPVVGRPLVRPRWEQPAVCCTTSRIIDFTHAPAGVRCFGTGKIAVRAKDGLLVVSILGPPNAGKSTLFNRFLCKELNRAYRLTSEKNRRRKVNSQGRLGSSRGNNRRQRGGAIVTDIPGTTRDRRECYGRLGGTVFRLVDTAGVDGERIGHLFKKRHKQEEKSLDRHMIEQTLEAAKAADLVLLMFDARVGVTSDLAETARWLRKVKHNDNNSTKEPQQRQWNKENQHVMVLANKLEGDRWQHDENSPVLDHLSEAMRVGFGEAVPISAEHGEGMADIATLIEELSQKKRKTMGYTRQDVITLPTDDDDDDDHILHNNNNKQAMQLESKEKPLQLAILGRPNVGKSTLVNSLLQQERVIAGSTPGLTRDSILVEWAWNDRPVQLVDTAGIRKITQRSTQIEDLSVQDANRAMKMADVAVLVLDAQAGNLQRQEMAIADAVVKEGRALVVAANKMDLVVDAGQDDGVSYTPEEYASAVSDEIEGRLPMLRKTPVVPMSSLTGENVQKLMPVVFKARERWERTVSTGLLNRWLADVIVSHPPPPVESSSQRATKIKYIIQTKGRPPTFLLFCNVGHLPPQYIRHLARNFQDTFHMFGMEVRLAVKKSSSDNPYEPKGSRRAGSGLGGRGARKKKMIQALKKTGAPPQKRRKRKRN
ncbi:GTPase Der [Seminavis robusta]|uniref:GTPase Der n=1 Tax=Seminavis robusta TaxID=568900 RepID=A0A9N8HJM7_9STRA|nr:GTPase Der [Seminavis robusta]|eukprot:Sro699_g189460.1 GTPase Der (666) ;mRNA; r:26141-28138